jgi:O-antigen ligase
MFPSFLLYIGLLVVLIGLLSLIRPWRFLRIRSRQTAGAVMAAGLLLVLCGFAWPAPEQQVAVRRKRLDELMPAWQFNERHRKHVNAPPDRVFEAI